MSRNRIAAIILAGCALIQFIILFSSDNGFGGADSYLHYQIAHYSWKHPRLFLDHWGKPLFTLLASPFAQFGYTGIRIFNILVGVAAALISLNLAKKLNLNHPYLVLLLLLLMPMYVLTLNSGLTEPLLSLFLVGAIWLYHEKYFVWGTLAAAFMLFVRNEAVVFLPLFGAILLYHKKYWQLLLFFSGIAVYSVAGGLYHGDYFWLINDFKYTGAKASYGSGSFFHFVINHDEIFGWPVSLLLLLGLGYGSYRVMERWQTPNRHYSPTVFLVITCFMAYFLAHSFVWWQGLAGSLGLKRVIAGVGPLAALIALTGLQPVIHMSQSNWFRKGGFALLVIILLIQLWQVAPPHLEKGREEKVIDKMVEWLEKEGLDKRKIWIYNPYTSFTLQKDPFDNKVIEQNWQIGSHNDPLFFMNQGEILIWDAHFGPNEGKTPLDSIMFKPTARFLKKFQPDSINFKVLGGANYEVLVFEKDTSYKAGGEIKLIRHLDEPTEINQEYFPILEGEYSSLTELEASNLLVDIKLSSHDDIHLEKIHLVLDFKSAGKTYHYEALPLKQAKQMNDNIYHYSLTYGLPSSKSENDYFQFYLWNVEKQDIIIKKLELKVKEIN